MRRLSLHRAGKLSKNISNVVVGKSIPGAFAGGTFIGGACLAGRCAGSQQTLLAVAGQVYGGLLAGSVCTDMLPSDITGFNVYDQKAGRFTFNQPGHG